MAQQNEQDPSYFGETLVKPITQGVESLGVMLRRMDPAQLGQYLKFLTGGGGTTAEQAANRPGYSENANEATRAAQLRLMQQGMQNSQGMMPQGMPQGGQAAPRQESQGMLQFLQDYFSRNPR